MSVTNASVYPPGVILADKFQVIREIGRGGMAIVYEAENIVLGKRVAVKVLSSELANSRIVNERFLREARAAANVRSPYICDVYDVGECDGRPFLVMELLEGESLYDRLTRDRQLSVTDTLEILRHTALGLSRAHQRNIVHRDLKPENILLANVEGGGIIAKLVDFGLAKFYEPSGDGAAQVRLTRDGALFGTPAYMSPEQAKAQGSVDHRADLWAMTCIAYEMLTGRTVWKVDQGVAMILAQIASSPLPDPLRYRPDLPKSFAAWFARSLDRNIDVRPQDAESWLTSLETALGGTITENIAPSNPRVPALSPLPSPQISTPNRHSTPTATIPSSGPASKKTKMLLGGLAIVLVGGAALSWYQYGSNFGAGRSESNVGELPDEFRKAKPKESGAAAEAINRGQGLVATNYQGALDEFRQAFGVNQNKVARSFISQLEAADNNGACKVSAIGHPRSFSTETEGSPANFLQRGDGYFAAWSEKIGDGNNRQILAAWLDSSLRRISEPQLLSPSDTKTARGVRLVDLNSGIGLVFYDPAPGKPGLYTRLLNDKGEASAPAQLISESPAGHAPEPVIVPNDAGGFWIAYTQPSDAGVVDLYIRQLSDKLNPIGDAIRLTALAPSRDIRRSAKVMTPSLVVKGGELAVAFVVERSFKRQVILLRSGQHIPNFKQGVQAVEHVTADTGGESYDRYHGEAIDVHQHEGKHGDTRLSCRDDACYLSWDDEVASAHLAKFKFDQGKPLWYLEFPNKSYRPSINFDKDGKAMAVWYEGGTGSTASIRIAAIEEQALGVVSNIGKVSGFQPAAQLSLDVNSGDWLLSFRDYEASRYEAFMSKVSCAVK